MNAIKEDYVSFEVAKLLKEKGFDIPVRYEYHFVQSINQKPQFHRHLHNFNGEEYDRLHSKWYSAPTLSMACKWLREVHHLTIDVFHFSNWRVNIKSIPDDYLKADYSYPELKPSETYEQACEVALKYTLENLI